MIDNEHNEKSHFDDLGLEEEAAQFDKKQLIKKLRIRYGVAYLILATANSIFTVLNKDELLLIMPPNYLGVYFLGALIWALALSFVFSFIPFKKIGYWKKYLHVCFIIAASLNLVFTLSIVLRLLSM